MTTSQEWRERLGMEEPTTELTKYQPRLSQRAAPRVREISEQDKPISEQYRLKAIAWADAENAAYVLAEMKTTTLEQIKSREIKANPSTADNKAERLAKASPGWEEYIRAMCAARDKANRLKAELKYLDMRHREWIAADANARSERKL